MIRWVDVKSYTLNRTPQSMFAGSDISSHDSVLTLTTGATVRTFRIKHTPPEKLTNLLGPMLAKTGNTEVNA